MLSPQVDEPEEMSINNIDNFKNKNMFRNIFQYYYL